MSKGKIGRAVLGVLAGYTANAILVAATEELLARLLPGIGAMQPRNYFAADLILQCLYTVIGGYLCCLIAGASQRFAMGGLIGIGVVVGTISLISSWRTEPHWYGIALLSVYPPCVWMGWSLRTRGNNRASSY